MAKNKKTVDIVGERWNQLHVYSFSINTASGDGTTTSTKAAPPKGMSKNFHDLNIAPQALNISTPFAISTVATNKGILEEHNGVVFRSIAISGTTGLYPDREAAKSSSNGAANSFKTTIPGIKEAVGVAKTATAGSVGKSAKIDVKKTGYYQFWELNNFLIQYAEAKKTKEGRDLRLVFNCPKDNIAYVVTPISFDMRKDASNPLLYYYSIQLRAWGVTSESGNLDPAFKNIPSKANKGTVSKTLDKMKDTRSILQKARDKMKSVKSDIDGLMRNYSGAIGKIKDQIGVAREISDMPDLIKNSVHNTIKNNQIPWKNITQNLINKKKINSLTNPFTTTTGGSGGKKSNMVNDAVNGILPSGLTALNGAGSRVNGDGSTPASINEEVNPESIQMIYKIVDDPDISEGILLSDLGDLSPNLQALVDERILESEMITPGQVRLAADEFKQVSDNLAYQAGMMNATYAKAYGIRIPTIDEIKEPTENDIILAVAIEEARNALLTTLASGDLYDEKKPNLFNVANDNLETIDRIVTPISAYPVPVSRGFTLEDLAHQHLKDATRAREIAILNDLISPYIDEKGFDQSIKNCTGRTFIVTNVEKLAIRQKITISGILMPNTRRSIVNIEDIGGGEHKITVDGKPDLSQYDASKSPKLFARLPGTVGSGDVLLMPSGEQADEERILKSTPLIERLSFAEKVFKVDLMLNPETNDLVTNSSGDVARSYGYNNAIQAIRTIVETERGELYLHRDYGLNLRIGQAITTEIYKEITERVRAAIIKDPRFSNALVDVQKVGTAVKVSVEVLGSNGTGRIPIEFETEI